MRYFTGFEIEQNRQKSISQNARQTVFLALVLVRLSSKIDATFCISFSVAFSDK
jgi:hypothetical protein